MSKPRRLIKPFIFLLLAMLSACAPQQREARAPAEDLARTHPAAPQQVNAALTALEDLAPAVRRPRTLVWSQQYLSSGRIDDATALLEQLDPLALEDDLKLRWILLRSQIHLARQEPQEALALLNSAELKVTALMAEAPVGLQNRLQLLRADALALNGQLVASVRERIAVHPLLAGEDRDYNREMIWSLLMHMPMGQLERLAQTSGDDLLGWATLATLFRDPLTDIDTQAAQLDQWRRQWRDHPAARHTPRMVAALEEAADKRPGKVAVILPFTGPLSGPAEAIRDGLLTGYYSALGKGHPVPSLMFMNSGSRDVIALYNEATAAGAEFVIGPLDKEQVTQLTRVDRLPVTTLALNYVDTVNPPANLYQFGLAPEDEARQVARRVYEEGARLAGLLYPSGDWGQRLAAAFLEEFQGRGGLVTTRQAYADNETEAVSNLLNINHSNARARELNRLTAMHLQSEPRRRQDLDVLFLVANADRARQVKPALNFHYASDLPVYATSHVYAGIPEPGRDQDLKGIRFVDVPWLLDEGSSLHKLADKTWPEGHGRLERLFALGVDAYRLQARLLMLRSVPDSQLPGVTGRLHVGPERHLVRELDWAFFQNGKPQRMPVVTGTREGTTDGETPRVTGSVPDERPED